MRIRRQWIRPNHRRVGALGAGLLLFLFVLAPIADADSYRERRIGDAFFVYPDRLAPAAEDLARSYPDLLADLTRALEWDYDRIPTIVLADNRDEFEDWAGTEYFSAFAVPDRELVVLDPSRMADAAAMNATLKHELCHLVLSRHIDRDRLPRWLNEGVAQWTSDGLSELLISQERISLPAAASSGRIFALSALESRFPHTGNGLALAYAQSRSVVDFIVRTYGRGGLLDLLDALRAGDSPDEAFRYALGVSQAELEDAWRNALGETPAWLLFLATYLYEILFVAAALATVYGFVRLRIRQRRYEEWEDEEGPFGDD